MASTHQQTPQAQEEETSSAINNSHVSFNTTIRLQPPTNANTEQRLKQIDELKYFLGTATNDWEPNRQVHSFGLPTGESISCVFWNDLFHVTGTDIVRCLLYRFHLFGRPVTNLKKFEEGIFSDLRNLKPGMDASLEEPKSEFLEMLYKNNCIRTQKKQKVFFWFSVPHDRLFLDALERDLKREKMELEPTSFAIAEPAMSLSLDTTLELFDQLRKSMSLSAVAVAHAMDDEFQQQRQLLESNPPSPTTTASSIHAVNSSSSIPTTTSTTSSSTLTTSTPLTTAATAAGQQHCSGKEFGHRSTRSLSSIIPPPCSSPSSSADSSPALAPSALKDPPLANYQQTSYSAGTSPKLAPCHLAAVDDTNAEQQQKIFGQFSLFEGSPTYKQRQRRRTFSTFAPFFPDSNGGNDRLELATMNAGLAINPQNLFQLLRKQQQQQQLEQQQCHERHQQTDKVYTCPLPQCSRLFKRLEHLKRHFRTHTLERPYSCNMCGKHFSRTDNLAQHKKTHNRGRNLTSSSLLGRSNSNGSQGSVEKETSINGQQQPIASTNSIVDKLSILTTNDTSSMIPIDYFYNNDIMEGSDTAYTYQYPAAYQYQQQQQNNDNIYYNYNRSMDTVCMTATEYDQVSPTSYDNPSMWQTHSSSTASSFYNQTNQRLSWCSAIDEQSQSSSPTIPYEQQQIYTWHT
ncbi:transcription factor STE12 [Mucor ambiguus]|uniref:Transcription factor STE12 n=1 Tax=Mucor ambiguus TaxID=91626 RepID=A0A0C9MN50_9FUNG|nr:transcription factor STE12 [Mucor ambiguus]